MSAEIEAMSHGELLEQAGVLGIEGAEAMPEQALRAALIEAVTGETTSKPKPRRKAKAENVHSDLVRIVVEESESDQQPVYVGLNGRSYRVKRGVEVDVPRGVANVLLTAKQKARNKDGTEREVPTYPTRIVA